MARKTQSAVASSFTTRAAAALFFAMLLASACGGATKAEEINAIEDLSVGEEHACLVERQYGVDGNGPVRSVIWCWGDGRNGELGDGTGSRRSFSGDRLDASGEKILSPLSDGAVRVVGIENAVSVAVVSNQATCAVAEDTGLYCWGESRPIGLDRGVWNSMGSTTGQAGENRRTPEKIMDGVELFAVANIENTSPDPNYACITRAFLGDSGVYCWGSELGTHGVDYASDWIDTPTLIKGLPEGVRAERLALTQYQACALLSDESVWCWGRGAAPERIDDREYFTIAASEKRVCGIARNNAVYCWGQSFTQQTDFSGTSSGFDQPVELDSFGLSPLDPIIAVGDEHVCLSHFEGVYCYGSNEFGQLGGGISRSPERIADRTAVRGIAPGVNKLRASDSGTCAIVNNEAVACWGAVPPVRSNASNGTVYTTPVVLTFNR